MACIRRLVCLANSRKTSGRCLAGRVLENGQPPNWIRPVSAREYEEVSEHERRYQDGGDPKPMDIIDVPLLGPRPLDCQTENWLLDPNCYWQKRGRLEWDQLYRLADPIADLWTNGSSTYHGRNDRMEIATASHHDHSLRLVRLQRLAIAVFAPGTAFEDSRRRLQARFRFNRREYRLWITDPEYERKFLRKENGEYQLGECYATISIGEPYNGYCYKLVAAIMDATG